MTKIAAIEGTAILANEGIEMLSKMLDYGVIKEASKLREQISVVRDGVHAFGTGHIHAMHDPTEGGLAGGIHELCDASGLGFEVNYSRIPICTATRLICEALQINPLELISSGTMIMSCSPQDVESLTATMKREGIDTAVIGTLVSNPSHRKIHIDGKIIDLERPENDALWSGLKKINQT